MFAFEIDGSNYDTFIINKRNCLVMVVHRCIQIIYLVSNNNGCIQIIYYDGNAPPILDEQIKGGFLLKSTRKFESWSAGMPLAAQKRQRRAEFLQSEFSVSARGSFPQQVVRFPCASRWVWGELFDTGQFGGVLQFMALWENQKVWRNCGGNCPQLRKGLGQS